VENEDSVIDSRMPNLKVFDLSLTESQVATGKEKRAEDQHASRSAATGSTTTPTRLEAIVSGSIYGSRGPESWSGWGDDDNAEQCTLLERAG